MPKSFHCASSRRSPAGGSGHSQSDPLPAISSSPPFPPEPLKSRTGASGRRVGSEGISCIALDPVLAFVPSLSCTPKSNMESSEITPSWSRGPPRKKTAFSAAHRSSSSSLRRKIQDTSKVQPVENTLALLIAITRVGLLCRNCPTCSTAGSSYRGAPAHGGGTYRTVRPRGGGAGMGKSWKKVKVILGSLAVTDQWNSRTAAEDPPIRPYPASLTA